MKKQLLKKLMSVFSITALLMTSLISLSACDNRHNHSSSNSTHITSEETSHVSSNEISSIISEETSSTSSNETSSNTTSHISSDNTTEEHEHVWDEGEVTQNATCINEGKITYKCTKDGCNETKIETINIDPSAHSLIDIEEHTSCFENGVVSHKECKLCHKLFTLEGVETTLEELSTIPCDKISHHYEHGTCTICGKAQYIATDFANVVNTTENTIINDTFSILATVDKPIELKSSVASMDGIQFVNRVSFIGKGTMPGTGEGQDGYRVLQVNVEGPCTIIVYAKKDNGFYLNIGQNVASEAASIIQDGNEQTLNETTTKHEFAVTEKGTYYIGTTASSCFLYYAAVQYYTNEEIHTNCKDEHFDNGVITSPTCTEEGKIVYTCLICGKTKEQTLEIDPTAHELITIEAKDANCSEKGNIEHQKCIHCGKLFLNDVEVNESDIEIPMIPSHSLITVDEVIGSCTTDTIAAHQECERCHKLFTLEGEETTLDALSTPGSHNYVNHVCTSCSIAEVISNDFSTIENGTYTENIPLNSTFGILATSSKNVVVANNTNENTIDSTPLIKRITLGGKGVLPSGDNSLPGYRVLTVSVDSPCTITIYASGNTATLINMSSVVSESSTTDMPVDGAQTLTKSIAKYDFTAQEAGTYYIGSTSGSCYLYYVSVQYANNTL